jgi:hypothetical protein
MDGKQSGKIYFGNLKEKEVKQLLMAIVNFSLLLFILCSLPSSSFPFAPSCRNKREEYPRRYFKKLLRSPGIDSMTLIPRN